MFKGIILCLKLLKAACESIINIILIILVYTFKPIIVIVLYFWDKCGLDMLDIIVIALCVIHLAWILFLSRRVGLLHLIKSLKNPSFKELMIRIVLFSFIGSVLIMIIFYKFVL